MERNICIHGHFYQPPRENPWLEAVELQHTAYPYHDWNERITAECYAPNSASRILDDHKLIVDIVDNYSKISFNFGPTLLSWMAINYPEVYQSILLADKESQKRFSGHGSALAQAYNHMIMPLANRRDKHTQIIWGIKDFEKRYNRSPEGMWLPETAVDSETLDMMAEAGIKFTILAPNQAKRIRRLNSETWEDVSDASIDPTRAYEVNLASGRKICVFFYDGPISRAVAFEGLLSSGVDFANRLTGGFSDQRDWPQLVHIATDGESYGHHHKFGDMALAYALHYIEIGNEVRLTNYGEFLEKHPPDHEVEILENTSWSCAHGVERWRANCGCNTGGHPAWNQEWRTSLRQAMDWVRDNIGPRYEIEAGKFLKDPWLSRDNYINLILDRSPENIRQFMANNALRQLNNNEVITVLKLLEMQRHAMLMYTSCGWFFDELSGIETVQVIQYAGRVVQLAQELFANRTEENFLKILEAAKSNLPENADGKNIYNKFVKPAMINLSKVAAHFAISSLFEKYPEKTSIYCYSVDVKSSEGLTCGNTRGVVGRARFTCEVTRESETMSYGIMQYGDHNINAGVRKYQGKKAYEELLGELTQTCSIADFPGTVRLLDRFFGPSTFSLKSLFRDEQNKVLDSIMESTLKETESIYRQIYQSHYPLMLFLADLGNPLPIALKAAAEFIVTTDLRRALSSAAPDFEAIKKLLEESRLWKIQLDTEGLAFVFRQTLEDKMAAFVAEPDNLVLLNEMESLVDLAGTLPFPVNTWQIQNSYFKMLKTNKQDRQQTDEVRKTSQDWNDHFFALGKKLTIRVP